MNPFVVLFVFRLIAACILAAGAVWLASESKDGWGWFLVGSVILGCVTYSENGGGKP